MAAKCVASGHRKRVSRDIGNAFQAFAVGRRRPQKYGRARRLGVGRPPTFADFRPDSPSVATPLLQQRHDLSGPPHSSAAQGGSRLYCFWWSCDIHSEESRIGDDAYLTQGAVLAFHELAQVNLRRIRIGTLHRARARGRPSSRSSANRSTLPTSPFYEGVPSATARGSEPLGTKPVAAR